MPDEVTVRAATPDDIEAIVAVFRANLADASLFQRTAADIAALLPDYFVATRDGGSATIVGCAALSHYPDQSAELHSVAVLPQWQGQHIGAHLVRAGLQRAGQTRVWLGTMKPAYFARFGFVPMSPWRIHPRIMLPKIIGVFTQPPARWLPALLGGFTFMQRHNGG